MLMWNDRGWKRPALSRVEAMCIPPFARFYDDGDHGDDGGKPGEKKGDKSNDGKGVDGQEFDFSAGGKTYKVPVSMKEALEAARTNARMEAERKTSMKFSTLVTDLQKQLGEKEGGLSELKAKMEDLEMAGKSELDQTKHAYEKLKKQYDTDLPKHQEESKVWKQKFEDREISASLYDALSGHDVYNQKQTVALLRTLGSPRVEQDPETKEFRVMISLELPNASGVMERQDLPPKEAVAKWLALDENRNQLKNSLAPGAGTSQTGGKKDGSGGIVYSRADMANPTVRAEYNKKLANKENVRIVG